MRTDDTASSKSDIGSPLPAMTPGQMPWTPIPLLKAEPALVKCENCGAAGLTKTEPANGLVTWLSFCGLSLAGLVCGCCLIPFCVGKCRDVKHKCSTCYQDLYRYERL